MPLAFLKNFKEFAMKGNVVDLAVWVIIGTAFGKIVSSLVADIAMPSLWVLLWGIDFTKYVYTVKSFSGGEVTIKFGQFFQNTFDFLIIAFAVFILVSLINRTMKKPEVKKDIPKPDDVLLLTEIRDLLAGKKPEKVPAGAPVKPGKIKKPAAKKPGKK